MKALYNKHLRQVEAWMNRRSQLQYLDVDYAQLVKAPEQQLQRINTFLGGDLDVSAMAAIADRKLYRNRK
jgi:hypothetical protein